MGGSCSQESCICTIVMAESIAGVHQTGKLEMDICLALLPSCPEASYRICGFWHHNFKLFWIKIALIQQRIFPLRDTVKIPLDPKLKMLPGHFGIYTQEGKQAKKDWGYQPWVLRSWVAITSWDEKDSLWNYGNLLRCILEFSVWSVQ